MSSEARANKQGQFGEMRRKWKFCLPVDKDRSALDQNKDRTGSDKDHKHTQLVEQGSFCHGSNKDRWIWISIAQQQIGRDRLGTKIS